MKLSKGQLAVIICAAVIIIDQIIKIVVKTSFYWGEDVEIFPWFHLRFIQNNGMAFGMELGSKLFLSLFRIVAVSALVWYMTRLAKNPAVTKGYMACISLITAGAAGNIVDCIFYGEIFTNPMPTEVATFVPWGEGYSTVFQGMVVDMFYFPLFQWNGVPRLLRFLVDSNNYFFGAIFNLADAYISVGGDTFSFFDPVFNFADAAITCGIFILIFFYYKNLSGIAESGVEESVDSEKKISAKDK